MSDIRVDRYSGAEAGGAAARAHAHSKHRAQGVFVEIADAARLTSLRAAWSDLQRRAADPNVFMDPALVEVAATINPTGQHQALLAWSTTETAGRLSGIWSFAISRPRWSILPMQAINIPAYSHAYLATPVIDRDCLDATLDAMLDRIAEDRGLPKIVALNMMGAGQTYEALLRVLEARGSAPAVFRQAQRPKLMSDLDDKAYFEKALSSATRKKLRQHRRRLSEKGTLTSSIVTELEAVRCALEEFLAMEASGWKGRNGTAILSEPADAAFMRRAMNALAEHGGAAIHSIYLDGKPVSMQLVARSGPAAFTWKTAYDEAYYDVSPGMLLLEDYTGAFLADQSIEFVDSCSFDASGFMSAWQERQTIADLWIDARRGGSLEFRTLAGLQKSYRDIRNAAKAAYLKWGRLRKA
jgi:CelD/BcsL family acetyltransferase involved in cellulose biosynthesis